MIKINKRPLPNHVTITREEDYRSGIVFQMLVEDSRGKCYICEDSVHTAPNVEHRISHKGDLALKYDWNNLFLACSHCNNTKLDKYDEIIDPAKVNPEKIIELSLGVDSELRGMVIVRKIKGNNDVDITVNLLNAVYNGKNTAMKEFACQQLIKKISIEMSWFYQQLEEYKKTPNYDCKTVIERQLSGASAFAAFKRGIVRCDHELFCNLAYAFTHVRR